MHFQTVTVQILDVHSIQPGPGCAARQINTVSPSKWKYCNLGVLEVTELERACGRVRQMGLQNYYTACPCQNLVNHRPLRKQTVSQTPSSPAEGCVKLGKRRIANLSLTLVSLVFPFRLAGGDSSVRRFDRHPAPDRSRSRRRSKLSLLAF